MTKNSDLWGEFNSRLETELLTGTRLLNCKKVIRGIATPQTYDEMERPFVMTHFGGVSRYEILDNTYFAEQLIFSVFIFCDLDASTDYVTDILNLRDGVLNTLETNSSGTADLTAAGKSLREWDFETGPIMLTEGGKAASIEVKVKIDSIQYTAGGR